jgi:hypothetical protein
MAADPGAAGSGTPLGRVAPEPLELAHERDRVAPRGGAGVEADIVDDQPGAGDGEPVEEGDELAHRPGDIAQPRRVEYRGVVHPWIIRK